MIISGGARGIDSIAHQSALKAGGRTIAVFGSGIDFIFPAENKKLFESIAESGAIVTEFPLGTVPEKFNFPMRNRIISGLARGTLVVEAPEKSGALITAELALQGGREVFAVPGRLTDMRSKGANLLIRDGAHPALDPTDIPLRFGLIVVHTDNPDSGKAAAGLEGDEALVYPAVGLEAKNVDDLVREVGLSAPRMLSTLLILQTRGLIRELPGSRFVRPVGNCQPGPETRNVPDGPPK
jgi:DNA processing protein